MNLKCQYWIYKGTKEDGDALEGIDPTFLWGVEETPDGMFNVIEIWPLSSNPRKNFGVSLNCELESWDEATAFVTDWAIDQPGTLFPLTGGWPHGLF